MFSVIIIQYGSHKPYLIMIKVFSCSELGKNIGINIDSLNAVIVFVKIRLATDRYSKEEYLISLITI